MYLVLCWPSHFSVTFLAGEVLCTEDEMASFAALLCHIHHHEYDSQRYLYTYVFALYAEYVLLLILILSRLCMYTKKYIQGTY